MLWRRITACITLVCLGGCYSIHLVDQQELTENPNYPIYAVRTSGGDYIEFEPDASLMDSMIVGKVSGGPSVELRLASIDSIYVKKRSKSEIDQRRVCCIGAVTLAVVLVIVLEHWIRDTFKDLIWGG